MSKREIIDLLHRAAAAIDLMLPQGDLTETDIRELIEDLDIAANELSRARGAC